MATIQNRSPLIVSVPRKPELRREFRHYHLDDAERYMRELIAGTHTAGKPVQPKVEQGDTSWEVRCRDKGFPTISVTFPSEREARDFAERMRVERMQGIVKDYNRAHAVTYADMLLQHLATHRRPKTFVADFYKIAAWLNDSGPLGQALLEKFRRERAPDGKTLPALKHATREPINGLEWIHKRLNAITAQDINGYVCARAKQVAPATIDREIDLFVRVFARAQREWDYELHKSPTLGIERPQCNNERDRRLRDNEEELLVVQARREDTRIAVEDCIEALIRDEFSKTEFSSLSAQKMVFVARRKFWRPVAERFVEHEREQERPPVPWVETFLQFQLSTAARRGEATGLLWRHVDLEEHTAFLPGATNSRSRKLPLRTELTELLARLPRLNEQVFHFGSQQLDTLWKRILKATGIEDLHIRDLRHEGISRVAETGAFTLLDLAAFSGHRELRMLQRHTPLCSKGLAHKLDEVFKSANNSGPYTGGEFPEQDRP